MIRGIFLLTFALIFGAGENLTLLCQTFCDRTASPQDAESCNHNQPAVELTFTSDVDCTGVNMRVPAVMRDETNRATSAPGKATPVSTSSETPQESSSRALAAAASCLAAGNPPRTIALRI